MLQNNNNYLNLVSQLLRNNNPPNLVSRLLRNNYASSLVSGLLQNNNSLYQSHALRFDSPIIVCIVTSDSASATCKLKASIRICFQPSLFVSIGPSVHSWILLYGIGCFMYIVFVEVYYVIIVSSCHRAIACVHRMHRKTASCTLSETKNKQSNIGFLSFCRMLEDRSVGK